MEPRSGSSRGGATYPGTVSIVDTFQLSFIGVYATVSCFLKGVPHASGDYAYLLW